MLTLIELFDCQEPVFNLLGPLTLKPVRTVYFGDSRLQSKAYRNSVVRTLRLCDFNTELAWEICSFRNPGRITLRLASFLKTCDVKNCMIDITGGEDILMLAVGILCAVSPVNVILYKPELSSFIYVCGPLTGRKLPVRAQFSLTQMFAMAGGKVLRNGHGSDEDCIAKLMPFSSPVFSLITKDQGKWNCFMRYFQQASKETYRNGPEYVAPMQIFTGQGMLRCPLEVFFSLREIGAIADLRLNLHECAFTLAFPEIRRYLADAGVWLELYLCNAMRKSGLFESVSTSVVVRWENDDAPVRAPENEVDVIGLSGIGQLFISCKLNPDVHALNELAAVTSHFGSCYAVPVLAAMRDVRKTNPALALRAAEMGIRLICGEELKEKILMDRLCGLVRQWNPSATLAVNNS